VYDDDAVFDSYAVQKIMTKLKKTFDTTDRFRDLVVRDALSEIEQRKRECVSTECFSKMYCAKFGNLLVEKLR